MNAIDRILSNIRSSHYGLGPTWSLLEHIVHKFHMMDLLNRIHQTYHQETLQNPPNKDLCDYLMQTKKNGIYEVSSSLHGITLDPISADNPAQN